MTTESKQRTITLTNRAPVRITEDQWPGIAQGCWDRHDGQIWYQANRTWSLCISVQRHADGRAIVSGVYDYDTNVPHEESEVHRVGSLLSPNADIPRAIQVVADQLLSRISDADIHRHVRVVANECIAKLPAQDLT